MILHKNKSLEYINEEFEECVCCGKITNVAKTMPLDMRVEYLPGAGQLCHECSLENINEEKSAMRSGFEYLLPSFEKGVK